MKLLAVSLSTNYGFANVGGRQVTTVAQVMETLFHPAFEVAAVAVTIYFLIGAFKFITSSGEKEKVASAQQMIVHAIIGFVMLIILFTILEFFFGTLGLQNFSIIPTP